MANDAEFGPPEALNATTLIDLALGEDLDQIGDLTGIVTIPTEARGAARFVSRSEGVIAGLPVVSLLAERFALGSDWQALVKDGDHVGRGAVVARITGP